MHKVLVLGCDGYIGEHLLEVLAGENSILFGYDIKNTKKNNSKFLNKFYLGDIQDIECLEKCILETNPNIIIDLAANADVHADYNIDSYKMNFCTPDNIFRILERNDRLNLSRLILTSSQYVIGPEHSGGNKLGYAPHTIYGISKVLLEQRALNLYDKFIKQGTELLIIRPTNVWGGRHPKYSNMWEKLLQKKLVIIPFKKVIKSYCHISSLCSLFKKGAYHQDIKLTKDNFIIYGTDAPVSQSAWVSLQVKGLKENGISANYHKAPLWFLYLLSRFLEILTRIFKVSNPLPKSRVDSMSYSYLVNLESPKELNINASYDEILTKVVEDVRQRKIG